MSNEIDSDAIRLIREMRNELAGACAEMRRELAELRTEVREGFAGMNRRIDGLANVLTLLAGVMHRRERRIARLEAERYDR